MASLAQPQLTLNFEPSLPERFGTLREYVAHRAMVVSKSIKTQAADMDLSPSTLSRKLNPAEGDTQRMNLDDFEGWLASTKDAAAVIAYLAAKYMDSDDARRTRVLSRVESMLPELMAMVSSLKETAA
jgi:hypothetical protein